MIPASTAFATLPLAVMPLAAMMRTFGFNRSSTWIVAGRDDVDLRSTPVGGTTAREVDDLLTLLAARGVDGLAGGAHEDRLVGPRTARSSSCGTFRRDTSYGGGSRLAGLKG